MLFRSGNKDITNRVRHIGNKFLNAVEVSAQEAVYLVLQMPLRRSSCDVQFISTSPPDERTFLIKKLEKLKGSRVHITSRVSVKGSRVRVHLTVF